MLGAGALLRRRQVELAPATALGWGPPAATQAQDGGDDTGKAEGDDSTTEQSHGVGLAGIEPATSSLSGMRSNRLSYSPGDRPRYPCRTSAASRLAPVVPPPGR